jgi:hypothetical protein
MSHVTRHQAAAHSTLGKAFVMSRHDAPPAVSPQNGGSKQLPTDDELSEIAASLRGLRYGSVSIIVQDGVIIQIDRVEKRRLRSNRQSNDNARG